MLMGMHISGISNVDVFPFSNFQTTFVLLDFSR